MYKQVLTLHYYQQSDATEQKYREDQTYDQMRKHMCRISFTAKLLWCCRENQNAEINVLAQEMKTKLNEHTLFTKGTEEKHI